MSMTVLDEATRVCGCCTNTFMESLLDDLMDAVRRTVVNGM